MSGIKGLVDKKMTQNYKFMGENVAISKLSVSQVMEIQEAAKKLEDDENDNAGLDVLRLVIRSSVEGAEELTDEDFEKFPMDELSKLSNAIMRFSGIGDEKGKSA